MSANNYYPLRPGKNSGEIVSDTRTTPTNDSRGHSETEYYGGYLVAESIPNNALRDQLIDAYNEKYVPGVSGVSKATVDEAMKREPLFPLIIVAGKPFSTRYKEIHASDLLSNVNDLSEVYAVMDKINSLLDSLLEKGGLVIVFPNTNGYLWKELLNKADVAIEDMNNDATDKDAISGPLSSVTLKGQHPAIDDQIKIIDEVLYNTNTERWLANLNAIKENLIAIKRYRETPKYIDSEKVIEDLLDVLKKAANTHGGHFLRTGQTEYDNAIQNAEAALGMFKALGIKDKRGHIGTPLTPKGDHKVMTQEQRDDIFKDIHQMLMKSNSDRGYANAIMFAIESVLDLKGL